MLRRCVSFLLATSALVSGCAIDSVEPDDSALGQGSESLVILPPGPTLIGPSGAVADSPSSVLLTWKPLSNFNSYEVSITQPDGSTIVSPSGWCDPAGASCFITFTPTLNGAQSFTVRGKTAAASTRWSAAMSFQSTQAGLPTWIGTTTVASLAVAQDHSCALLSDGSARCWGANSVKQLGDGTTENRSSPVFVGTLSAAVGISTAINSSCARMPDSTLTCWGARNLANDFSARPPTTFPGLTGVASTTGKYGSMFAILNDTTVRSWGSNIRGVLGNGTTTDNPAQPTTVIGLTGVSQIDTASAHACARLSTGMVACWGDNQGGQLGLGVVDEVVHPTPQLVPISGVAEVAVSQTVSCARMADATVRCWGTAASSCLLGATSGGTGCVQSAMTPTALPGLTGVQQLVGGGSFFCARYANGAVSCWGKHEQVIGGPSATGTSKTFLPTGTADVLKASFLAASGNNVCAIVNTSSGKHGVVCWGENSRGEAGNARTADRAAPGWALVNGGSTCTGTDLLCPSCGGNDQMCCGTERSCNSGFSCQTNTCLPCGGQDEPCCTSGAACESANLVCSAGTCEPCGSEGDLCCGGGACGTASQCVAGSCAACGGPGDVCCTDETSCEANLVCGQSSCGGCTASMRPGNAFACVVRADQTVWCWGDNSRGQLGIGNWYGQSVPTRAVMPAAAPVTGVATGDGHACAWAADGSVFCWGNGQINPTLKTMPAGAPIVDMVAGGDQTCAKRSDGSVLCWTTSSTIPQQMTFPAGVQINQVAIGSHHACALSAGNDVYCWGTNTRGQLGTGDLVARYSPAKVVWLSGNPATGYGASKLIAGNAHTCLLQGDQRIWCWGDNQSGQLGQGITSTEPAVYPVVAQAFSGATSISAGSFHTCALDSSSRVWCWGMNSKGQLGHSGDGVMPGMVADLPEKISDLEAGEFGTCARSVNDVPWCWGAVSHYGITPVTRIPLHCQD